MVSPRPVNSIVTPAKFVFVKISLGLRTDTPSAGAASAHSQVARAVSLTWALVAVVGNGHTHQLREDSPRDRMHPANQTSADGPGDRR